MKTFSSSAVGDKMADRFSVDMWHIMSGSALYNDFGPNHVDFEHAENNRFGKPISHGFTTAGQMMGILGRHFGWSIEAFLEAYVRFVKPVFVGDTVDANWVITEKQAKDAFSGGILTLDGTAWSGRERRQVVAIEAKLAISDRNGPS